MQSEDATNTIDTALFEALAQVRRERERQQQKWGTQRHGMPVWLTVLAEEVGEASQDVLGLRSCPPGELAAREAKLTDLAAEVTQIAAVAVAWLEHINEAIREGEGMPGETWQ